MPFIVPKFINEKPKIIGPLTFRQFIFIGIAVSICFVLYSFAPFFVFLAGSVFLIGGGTFLAFGKINGRPLPVMIKNFFAFLSSSKIYLWEKAKTPPQIIKTEGFKKEEKKTASALNITARSKLRKLSSEIETKRI